MAPWFWLIKGCISCDKTVYSEITTSETTVITPKAATSTFPGILRIIKLNKNITTPEAASVKKRGMPFARILPVFFSFVQGEKLLNEKNPFS